MFWGRQIYKERLFPNSIMMVFAGHLGVALIIAAYFNLNPLLTGLGGMLPDLDTLVYFFTGKNWGRAHRKITHSLLLPACLFIISFFYPLMFPVTIGVLVHFVLDMDHWGIPLFFPFIKREYSFFEIEHGEDFMEPQKYITHWFKKRGKVFWLEWTLLLIGLILTWDYWLALIELLIPL